MMPKLKPSYAAALKYGLLVAAAPIVYNTILLIFNLHMNHLGDDPGGPLRVAAYFLFLPIAISVSIYRYKKTNGGLLKLKDSIAIGLKIAFVASFFIIIYDILFNEVLAPTYYNDYYKLNGEELYKEFVECCNYTKEQFEHHKNVRFQNWKSYPGDLLSTMIIGLIVSTIVGLIMRKKKK